ncbi:hypothetical protein GQ43DRAFT_48450 [Delitschia confertaspora ATCC 74209]|uniref:Uncharacterized protein n=1 Tax=Delitschia confertaspora ATCC 74209 TaxID=1513339 RepID=A0A9P4JL27_9PLEO|nr:hypothetical protein GQ43DRAFT_48450 [Delitschia confertaspora ATCC 74209]
MDRDDLVLVGEDTIIAFSSSDSLSDTPEKASESSKSTTDGTCQLAIRAKGKETPSCTCPSAETSTNAPGSWFSGTQKWHHGLYNPFTTSEQPNRRCSIAHPPFLQCHPNVWSLPTPTTAEAQRVFGNSNKMTEHTAPLSYNSVFHPVPPPPVSLGLFVWTWTTSYD